MTVVNPLKGGQFEQPRQGMQFAAVQFRIANTGIAAYQDSPMNGAKVSDAQGNSSIRGSSRRSAPGPVLPATVNLTPGSSALGYVAFQIPKGTKPTGVEFAMNSGFGGVAQWKI